jgi:hypothetical protein
VLLSVRRSRCGESCAWPLTRALEGIRKQHQWGDLTDDEDRQERAALESQMAALSGTNEDRLVAFRRNRSACREMAESVDAASPEQQAELVSLVVERIETRDRQLASVVSPPPARPLSASLERAVWDSNPRHED